MKPLEHRTGENGVLPFRTQRVFNIGSEWYFAVRGGDDCGPFQNQQQAITGLDQFLNELKTNQLH